MNGGPEADKMQKRISLMKQTTVDIGARGSTKTNPPLNHSTEKVFGELKGRKKQDCELKWEHQSLENKHSIDLLFL